MSIAIQYRNDVAVIAVLIEHNTTFIQFLQTHSVFRDYLYSIAIIDNFSNSIMKFRFKQTYGINLVPIYYTIINLHHVKLSILD